LPFQRLFNEFGLQPRGDTHLFMTPLDVQYARGPCWRSRQPQVDRRHL